MLNMILGSSLLYDHPRLTSEQETQRSVDDNIIISSPNAAGEQESTSIALLLLPVIENHYSMHPILTIGRGRHERVTLTDTTRSKTNNL